MTSKQLYKLHTQINDQFTQLLGKAFEEKFGEELEFTFNILSLCLISRLKTGKKISKQQLTFIQTWEAGYLAAQNVVWMEFYAQDLKEQKRQAAKQEASL